MPLILDKLRLRWMARREYDSGALRTWFAQRWGVEVGLYSYGCFDPWRVPARTRIGRYCSIAKTARVLDANHPIDALTTHPFLYEKRFGIVDEDRIDPEWLIIEDDVWISHNATISPGCKFIGRGAVIGAGSVVTRDVPPYAIVAGAPARLLRSRFDADTIALIEASQWWLLDRDALADAERAAPKFLTKPSRASAPSLFAHLGRPIPPVLAEGTSAIARPE